MHAPKPPRAFRELRPTEQTVSLGGHAINLVKLSEALDIDHGYLSRVCSGKRVPSLPYVQAVSTALGWTIQQLLDAIAARKQTVDV